jgi:sugar fermentation stimulation protein A
VAARPARPQDRRGPAVALPLGATLAGRLVAREKRFLADVALADGRIVRAHLPDPGRMPELAVPGARVRLSTSDAPHRRLAHTVEIVRQGRTWVGVYPARANALMALALATGALPALRGYTSLRREAAAPGGCRIDFRLTGHPRDPRPCWLEVKSATWADGAVARFPDSPTARGRRHVETLATLVRAGARAVLLFVVARGDCRRVEPAAEMDPAFADALRAAAGAGVELRAVAAPVSPRAMVLGRALPVHA